VSYVFQHPHLQTVSPTIKQELELEPKILKWEKERIDEFVDDTLNWLGIEPEKCPLDIHPADKRLLMIGASSHGSLLILDEPTIDLDTKDIEKVLKFVYKLRLRGVAVVLITHDHDLIQMADRVVFVDDGRVVRECIPQEKKYENSPAYAR